MADTAHIAFKIHLISSAPHPSVVHDWFWHMKAPTALPWGGGTSEGDLCSGLPCRVRLRLEFCLKLHLCLASCPFLSCSPLCGFLFIKLLHFFNSSLELCFRVGFCRTCPRMIILRTHEFFYHFLFSDNFISALTVIIFFFLIDLGLYSSFFSLISSIGGLGHWFLSVF